MIGERIAIHASKLIPTWTSTYRAHKHDCPAGVYPNAYPFAVFVGGYIGRYENWPYGMVIATAVIKRVLKITCGFRTDVDVVMPRDIVAESIVLNTETSPNYYTFLIPSEREITFGKWVPGWYAWELSDVIAIPECQQVEAKGRLGLWEFES
jgi:hypothetical protein